MGRGGAVVVSARDPHAIAINPALIALTEGHQILVDFNWAMFQLDYTRAPQLDRGGKLHTFESIRNEAPGVVVPEILFTTDFGTDTLGLGFGVFPPSAAPARYPIDGPQRYAIIDMANTITMTIELAFAWRPHPRFSMGAGIQNIIFVFKGAGISSTYFGVLGEAEDPSLDSIVSISANDYFTPSANFGLWAEPVDGFEIGLAFQLFADIKSKNGKFKAALPDHFVYDSARLEGSKMDMSMSLPWNLRLGLRYVHGDVFDIEIDAWFERWSRHKEINIYAKDAMMVNNALVGDMKIDDFVLPRNMKDSWGISIGADWHVIPDRLTLRAGFFYESGAARDENYSVFQFDGDKLSPSIGLSVLIDFARIDFAFAHVHQLPKTITNGTYKQYNLVYPEHAVATNNGDYKSFYDFIGLGVNFSF